MSKLVTLSGNSLTQVDPQNLEPADAAIFSLYKIAKANPGITWGELFAMGERGPLGLSGWWTDMKRSVGDMTDAAGTWIGDAVRLFTDEQVMDGVSRYGQAYLTGGKSEAYRAMFPGADPDATAGFLNQYGRSVSMDLSSPAVIIGIGAAFILVMMMATRKNQPVVIAR